MRRYVVRGYDKQTEQNVRQVYVDKAAAIGYANTLTESEVWDSEERCYVGGTSRFVKSLMSFNETKQKIGNNDEKFQRDV
jgi:hypothetical protein